MATARGDNPPQQRPSIPWSGARKMARKLALEVQQLRADRDAARDQLERFSTMGRELVAEVKVLRAQREVALKHFEKIRALHERLADRRANLVNQRREFFRVSPPEVKGLLSALAGELRHFQEVPDAIEYRQCLQAQPMALSLWAALR